MQVICLSFCIPFTMRNDLTECSWAYSFVILLSQGSMYYFFMQRRSWIIEKVKTRSSKICKHFAPLNGWQTPKSLCPQICDVRLRKLPHSKFSRNCPCAHTSHWKNINYLICIEHTGCYCGIADSIRSHSSLSCSNFHVSVIWTPLRFARSWSKPRTEQRHTAILPWIQV